MLLGFRQKVRTALRAFFERRCVRYHMATRKAGRKVLNPIAYRWFRFCAWCEFRLRPSKKPLTYTLQRIQSIQHANDQAQERGRRG